MRNQHRLLCAAAAGILIAAMPSAPLHAGEPEKKTPVQGTVQLTKKTPERDYAALSKVSIQQAAQNATARQPGTVIEAKLTPKNGFLVWEIDIIGAKGEPYEALVDAGTGKVLACGPDEEDDDEENGRD
jgi:uncharacterized membrane protein YkoI